jgi:transcription initiation factor TFIID subunit 8
VPTLPDVEVALADSGLSTERLEEYSKRPERRHVPKQGITSPPATPNIFQTTTKAARPQNVPDYLPPLPNPHTFHRTPSFPKPSSDYQLLREKISTQMKDSRRSLSRLLSKTRPSIVVIGSEDSSGNYSCIIPTPPKDPAFLSALIPSPEDLQEVEKEERLDDNTEMEDSIDETPPTLSGSQPPVDDCLYLKPPKKAKMNKEQL